MDFDLNEEQQAVLAAVGQLLAQRAGAGRAIELAKKSEYDGELEAALSQSGFLDVALDEEMGFLEAVLVTEAVSAAAGVVSIGAQVLVAPGLLRRNLPGPVAVTRLGHRGPVRFGAHARTLLLDAGDEARWIELDPTKTEPVRSNFGYPMGPSTRSARSTSRWAASRSIRSRERVWDPEAAPRCGTGGVLRSRRRLWAAWDRRST